MNTKADISVEFQDSNPGYDLIVVGGGIYGILITLESSLRGLKPLLVERSEFGQATTANWLRVLHGGLRYLQSADLVRFFESVRERRWFIQQFPEYIEPLTCVMPLYRSRSHPAWLMRAGLAANDLLSLHRNSGVTDSCRIPRGRVISSARVLATMPFVSRDKLCAGALWTDAIVTKPDELISSLLDWCRAEGATVLDGHEVVNLQHSDGKVSGVMARNSDSGEMSSIMAPVIINAAGHWAPKIAKRFGAEVPPLPRLSWAWNVLFDVPIRSEAAAAVSAPRPNAQNLFVVPWEGKALVGTGHACVPEGTSEKVLPADLLGEFVIEVAEALPELGLSESAIEKVFLGWMPVDRCDPLRHASRAMILDHTRDQLSGLWSVWGVKYTTARDVASQVVRRAFPSIGGRSVIYRRPDPVKRPS